MKTKFIFLAGVLLLTTRHLSAQSTAFNYQGRLNSAGVPANGPYEMAFTLYDALTNGNVIGTPQSLAPVAVSNGLFTVQLDFGASAFMGADRWLEITVNLFGSDMVPTTLVPRQPLTPVPYALYAFNAAGLMSFASAPLDIKINGQRVMRYELTGNAPHVIGGWSGNFVAPGLYGATIAGGGVDDDPNSILGNGSTIGGGQGQTVGSEYATIAGGQSNRIEDEATGTVISGGALNRVQSGGDYSVIGGGAYNLVGTNSAFCTIAGGEQNHAAQDVSHASIGGGEQNQASGWWATVGGGERNTAASNGATVAGGLQNTSSGKGAMVGGGEGNSSADDHTTVGGGFANSSTDLFATVGGGGLNQATGFGAVVAGGGGVHFEDGNENRGNTASGQWSSVLGGADNVADGLFSAIAGGEFNRASGPYGIIPGGLDCEAAGQLSFAAGWGAKALHDGSFVWADNSPTFGGPPFTSTTNNQFNARAAGGVRFFTDSAATTGAELVPGSGSWSSLSDRNAKENFAPASGREILDKLAALPLASWNYKAQDRSIRHLGPTAQDFHTAFGLGENERTISTVDADGVALAAIQGLDQKLEHALNERDAEIRALKSTIEELKSLVQTLAQKSDVGR